jgi:lysophospholipase L1-like esterase
MRFFLIFFLLLTLNLSAQNKIKVACIGNSITEGADIERGSRYPDVLQQLLGDSYEVSNFGIGSRTLLKRGDFPYSSEEKYKEALAWLADVVIIKLGTNDSKPQNWIYSDEFEDNYKEFIRSFKSLPGQRKIFICVPVPVFKDEWGITESIIKDEISPMIAKIAKSEHVSLVDLRTPLTEKPELFPDGVHPNADGARVIAQIVFGEIVK